MRKCWSPKCHATWGSKWLCCGACLSPSSTKTEKGPCRAAGTASPPGWMSGCGSSEFPNKVLGIVRVRSRWGSALSATTANRFPACAVFAVSRRNAGSSADDYVKSVIAMDRRIPTPLRDEEIQHSAGFSILSRASPPGRCRCGRRGPTVSSAIHAPWDRDMQQGHSEDAKLDSQCGGQRTRIRQNSMQLVYGVIARAERQHHSHGIRGPHRGVEQAALASSRSNSAAIRATSASAT